MFAVDSCSQDEISSNPYWSMTDSQRAEWKSYSRARLQQQQQQEEQANEDGASDDGDDEEVDNNNDNDDDDDEIQQDAPTPDVSTNKEPVAKQDKRKLWVTYQAWARQTLKEQHPDQQKFPLTEVNKLARTAWAEDGWAK